MAFIYLPGAISSTYTKYRRDKEFHADNQNIPTPLKKKARTPSQAEMFNQPTERISDKQRLRIQSDEIGK